MFCRIPERQHWVFLGPLLLLIVLNTTSSLANIQVFPTRIVLTDENRVANISVRHRGNKPGSYSIQAVFYRMSEDGNMSVVETPTDGERSALKILRFSPRKTTLPPNLEQVVRIMVAGPKDLPEGDYRAHLHFVPTDDAESDTVNESTNGKIQMAVEAKLAVAIPVIYRHGSPKSTVALSKLKLTTTADKRPAFWAEMDSSGTAFPYGDLYAIFTPKGGTPSDVGVARGVAGYAAKRIVTFPITPGKGPLVKGTLRLEMREATTAVNEVAKVLATTEAELP